MADHQALRDELTAGYRFAKGDEPEPPSVLFGRPLTPDLEGTLDDVGVRLPLRMLNRHGLIAGATGTGKTKTLQLFAEQLSEQGVPVFLADLKGDLTGLADPCPAGDREGFVDARMTAMGFELGADAGDERTPVDAPDSGATPPLWRPRTFPVELLSLTGEQGHQVRVPLREFGPLLLAKVMDCSEVQESVLQVIFRAAEDAGRPMDTIEDFSDVLRWLTSEEGKAAQDEYGGMSTTTLNVLRRKVVEIEGQGADAFFGAPGFDVTDLWAPRDGEPFGVISILRLVDVQARPRIFSTFLMWLLSAAYANADELGDPDRPRMVFFFDEAHLLFEGASRALVELVELTVRMIRSKGIGVFFVTQQPADLPDDVLAQLGNRVQHALRAFTPKDQTALKQAAQTYPVTEHYDVREALTSLGIGEALLVGLGRKGAPTPTVAARLVAPRSSMEPVDDDRLAQLVAETRARFDGRTPAAAPKRSPDSADDLVAAGAPTPALATAAAGVTAGEGELFRAMVHRCALVQPSRPVSRTARSVRTAVPGASPMRRDLTKDVVAVAGGLGLLSLTPTAVRFGGAGGDVVLDRAGVDELQWLHGLVVIGDEVFLIDPDDQRELLGAWDPAWGAEDLASLAMPPDELLDELAALDEDTVDAGVRAGGGVLAAPPPAAADRIDAPAPEETRAERRAREKVEEQAAQEAASGPKRSIGDIASSTTTEEVAATALKMVGINKGTTRSLFRAWRKGRG